ncbi:hypothetical protein DL767_008955 [Monosporascus sp. MG133]|nr:hypothetical protein DL767_008955 [Monosporascus sp. MG133]
MASVPPYFLYPHFANGGSGAVLSYKAVAFRSLQSLLVTELRGITEAQLTTAMMLFAYDVFDESERSWHVHLHDAGNIMQSLMTEVWASLTDDFLITLILYHEILGGFRNPRRHGQDGPASLQYLKDTDYDKPNIIGSLGCFVEVMEIITYTGPHNGEWHAMEGRIKNLEQRLDPDQANQLTLRERLKIRPTAELHRITALLYLERTCGPPELQELRAIYLQQPFHLLDNLEVCTSALALFMIACESETDEQRIRVFRVLD